MWNARVEAWWTRASASVSCVHRQRLADEGPHVSRAAHIAQVALVDLQPNERTVGGADHRDDLVSDALHQLQGVDRLPDQLAEVTCSRRFHARVRTRLVIRADRHGRLIDRLSELS
jgi:hypothetical protein